MSLFVLPSKPKPRLSIMQGRLSPPVEGRFQCFPRDAWETEIAVAQAVPLDGIEWIYDVYGQGVNPIETDSRLEHLRAVAKAHHVCIRSLCADYFMDLPILRVSEAVRVERVEHLRWLIGRCGRLGVARIVLPFVDASRIESREEGDTVVSAISQVLPEAEAHGIELHLETDLAPSSFAALMEKLGHPLVKINYDVGNSASLGYRPAEEFDAYGHRVGSIHIKDRVRGGGTVPLGSGSADFASLRRCLTQVGFDNDFVLQVARGEPGDELAWIRGQGRFVIDWWTRPLQG